IKKIQRRLPYLFQIAELESSRAGKVGMEVGTLREKIIVALLMHKFGEDNIKTPNITEPEVDVYLFESPISIKTIKGKTLAGVKLIWTVNGIKAEEFVRVFSPRCDLILIQIQWDNTGGFYYIPMEAQRQVFEEMGPSNYIKLPKPATNPRGTEITREALARLVQHPLTKSISIEWKKMPIDYRPFQRWVELWQEE
ncbi:MAG TPA: ThaI family type II restriction endonuclease, partial [Thermoguttaceae bacterium]|nr:ThaI family type II restriction endonuclease [Thermoguttaceae bacterium]